MGFCSRGFHEHPFFSFTDHLNGDYIRHSSRSPSPNKQRARSRSRSPRGFLSVRKSPELRGRSLSPPNPSREAVQNAAREAAEAAIRMAEAENRKSPPRPPSLDRTSARSTPEKNGLNSPTPPMPPTSNAALQNLLSGLAAGPSLLGGLQQPQLLAAFATLAAMSNSPASPPVSMAGFPGMFPGLNPAGSDPSAALQTLAQLQTLFNPAAAQMMSMQQVCQNTLA